MGRVHLAAWGLAGAFTNFRLIATFGSNSIEPGVDEAERVSLSASFASDPDGAPVDWFSCVGGWSSPRPGYDLSSHMSAV